VNASRMALVVSTLALAGSGLWYWLAQLNVPNDTLGATTVATTSTANASPSPFAHAGGKEPQSSLSSTASHNDYANAFRASTDYRDFILAALPAAQKGNADAAYYLSAALAYCDETYRFFFKKRDRTLKVDEAIADKARFPWPNYTDAIRLADARCHEVNAAREPRWGTADQWLAMAAEAGQPIAQIQTAASKFIAASVAGQTQKPSATGQNGELATARTLARVALETRQPEVVFQMADLLALFKPEISQSDFLRESLTWRYAACLRGLDCSATAEWYRQICLADPGCLPGDSGSDYLRRTAESVAEYDIEQKATELNAKLDAQAWKELGFGD
jgi:hypothetical protein